ncbi:AzlD domain-containing protein [Streptomyces armeniacus]|uniref:AzlD domain-containing protein n=1 Tax=Streptomyces armeniacus TaxID=83291 RepID=A0A345XP75_9ACTN|nr:AzlD domain-containing protein [Streptomyces armeniacus]AXK33441.1 AzlD domain-containing protein [Streptomyces armeniacus]
MSAHTALVLGAVAVLAAGTFTFRFAGPLLRARLHVTERAERLMTTSAVVLLVALVATTALSEGAESAGVARPAGVAMGGVLAWRRLPFVVVVLAAAATAALLRLLGVP